MNWKRFYAWMFLVFLCLVIGGLSRRRYSKGYADGYNYIKSPAEQQQQLVDLGYDIGPDGIDCDWGTNSETARGLAYGQQSADVSINPNTMKGE